MQHRAILNIGVFTYGDKISINTAAVNNPNIISEASTKYGSSTVVVSIDYKKSGDVYSVWTNGGKQKTDLDPVNWALECEKNGAGEILLCSIDKDGTNTGLDLKMTQRVSQSISISIHFSSAMVSPHESRRDLGLSSP